ncbi:hypothetical protein L0F63_006679 [Massospora cicadina]|nr:hypothetical protein L0F63_006679 [Massospora cicadina]
MFFNVLFKVLQFDENDLNFASLFGRPLIVLPVDDLDPASSDPSSRFHVPAIASSRHDQQTMLRNALSGIASHCDHLR